MEHSAAARDGRTHPAGSWPIGPRRVSVGRSVVRPCTPTRDGRTPPCTHARRPRALRQGRAEYVVHSVEYRFRAPQGGPAGSDCCQIARIVGQLELALLRVREWPVPPANEATQVALIQIFGTVAFTIVWQPAANVAKHSACAETPANTRIVRAWPSGVAIDAFTTELPAPDAEFPQATGESSE